MFMRAMVTPSKPPTQCCQPTPRKVGIMITHVVRARHLNIVAGGWEGGGKGRRDEEEAGTQIKMTMPMHMKLQMRVREDEDEEQHEYAHDDADEV